MSFFMQGERLKALSLHSNSAMGDLQKKLDLASSILQLAELAR